MRRISQEIVDEALAEYLNVINWRRELHSHPELSFREHTTARFIGDLLDMHGIPYENVAGTGVLARIKGEGEGDPDDPAKSARHGTGREADAGNENRRAVVLRADIDALPITENTGFDYASKNNGVMHACGHDIHTAVLLGALVILNRHKSDFKGTVFGLFQPGEESNPGGASLILQENLFDGFEIAAFVGEHVEPLMETGKFGFRTGQYMAASDELRFTVKGTGGHAALRDKIKDPVQAAARLIDTLYSIPGSEKASGRATIISIGKLSANGATNVVPDEVYLEGTMRTFDEEWRAELKEIIRTEASRIDGLFGVITEVNISDGYPSVFNDPALTEKVMGMTSDLWGTDKVESLALRNTSDDFGFYSRLYPSVYYRLGVGGAGETFANGEAGRVHTPVFRPDEKALGYGVVQFLNIIFGLL